LIGILEEDSEDFDEEDEDDIIQKDENGGIKFQEEHIEDEV
jgi:hypothetical protein